MRRLLSVWLPCWATLRLRRRHAGAPECPSATPLATVTTVRGVRRLVAVDPLAEAAGLAPDMPFAQARAICPGLELAEADPAAEAAGLAALAAWCTRYTPLAAADPPEGLVLDISGCAHLFGGEAALAADLRMRLGRVGLAAQVAT
ncbi:MAG: DNA polymerase Y family protein, partial [Alphaproteobacteria bacterium]|nr:DNA polymerase Y family protein [Alphaproteobacteria bacterium]